MRRIFTCIATILLWTTAAHGQTPPARLLSFDKPLQISRWWPAAPLQERINTALASCGKTLRINVDFHPGPRTAAAIQQLRACPSFQIDGEEGRSDLTVGLWTRLFPSAPPPTAAERIHMLVLTFESTDYDAFLWNVGQPADSSAWGTWGPFGATLAHSAEIQKIIDRIEARAPGLIERVFGEAAIAPDDYGPKPNWRSDYCAAHRATQRKVTGYLLLRSLSKPISKTDEAALSDEFCDDATYTVWYRAFQRLAQEPVVRAAYDEHYREQNRRIVSSFSKAYEDRGHPRTETDWAFFLDRSTQFTTDMRLVGAELDKLPPDASPGQRRLAISRASRPKHDCPKEKNGVCVSWTTRVGRDMSYVVDALGESVMQDEELGAWRRYGERRVSSLGLDDTTGQPQPPY